MMTVDEVANSVLFLAGNLSSALTGVFISDRRRDRINSGSMEKKMTALSNKTILLTGASKGIGAAIARRLSDEEVMLIAHFGRDRAGAGGNVLYGGIIVKKAAVIGGSAVRVGVPGIGIGRFRRIGDHAHRIVHQGHFKTYRRIRSHNPRYRYRNMFYPAEVVTRVVQVEQFFRYIDKTGAIGL